MSKRFTAIIVNYNGSDFLAGAVDSIIDAGISPEKIIIIDNGSTDDSITHLSSRHPSTIIIQNPCNAGFSAAVNRGLSQVNTEFALLFNNDAMLDGNALIEFEKVFDNKNRSAILGAKLLNQDGSTQNSVAAYPTLPNELIKHNKYKNIIFNKPTEVDSVIGACLAVRMSILQEIGLLDEAFFFFLEETELCLRAKIMGYKIYHVPDAIAIHAQGGTANKFRTAARIEFQRSKLTYYRKTGGTFLWLIACLILTLKALINFTSNGIGSIITLGINQPLRSKTTGYLKILLWHILFHPENWGLPDKCK